MKSIAIAKYNEVAGRLGARSQLPLVGEGAREGCVDDEMTLGIREGVDEVSLRIHTDRDDALPGARDAQIGHPAGLRIIDEEVAPRIVRLPALIVCGLPGLCPKIDLPVWRHGGLGVNLRLSVGARSALAGCRCHVGNQL